MSDFDKLRNLMGYVENGTEAVVKIFQDECTRDYFVKARGESYCAITLSEAIDKAYQDQKQEF